MKVKRPFLIGTIIVLLILLIAVIVYAMRMRPQVELGVGYGAHVVCSCRYIGGRDLDQLSVSRRYAAASMRVSSAPSAMSSSISQPSP